MPVTIIATDHTAADYAALLSAGIDNPDAATQAREHPVPCHRCGRPTRNIRGGCDQDGHYREPRAALEARLSAHVEWEVVK